MNITLYGPGSDSFLEALRDGGIPFEHVERPIRPGVIMAKSGDVIAIIKELSEATPWTQIANVFTAWIKARASRQMKFTIGPGKITTFEGKGFSAAELAELLKVCIDVSAVDLERIDSTEPPLSLQQSEHKPKSESHAASD